MNVLKLLEKDDAAVIINIRKKINESEFLDFEQSECNTDVSIEEEKISNSNKQVNVHGQNIYLTIWRGIINEKKEIVGLINVQRSKVRCRQHVGSLSIGIIQSERGKGLGKAAILEMFIIAKENGIEFLTLTVDKKNKGARSLYQKLGFKKIGKQKCSKKKYVNGILTYRTEYIMMAYLEKLNN